MKMKIDGRLFIVFIMVLALIPVTYGGSVSVGRGSSVAVSGGSSAAGILVSDGSVTHSAVSSSGVIDNLNIDPWVKNAKGDYAEIGVTGTNVAGLSYSDNYYPGKGSGWVSDEVYAQQWLSASSADSLNVYAYASNSAGDTAGADLNLKSGSLKDYYSGAYAGTAPWLGIDSGAFAQQTLNNANGNAIQTQTWAVDPAGDAAGALTSVEDGALNGYSVQSAAAQYSNGLSASGVSIDSMSASAPSGSINNVVDTYDNTGDLSSCGTFIDKGDLSGSTIAYSRKDLDSVTSVNINSATGSLAEITSHAENRAVAEDPNNPGVPFVGGSADFEALKTNGDKFTNPTVTTTAKGNDVTIALTGFTKTALLLEPFKWIFGDYYGTVGSALEKKGYAVTDYSNAGVSWDKVYQLDKNTVSLIDTHGVVTEDTHGNVIQSNGLAISKTGGASWQSWAQLQSYLMNPTDKGKNSLMILDACDTFFKNPSGQLSGQDVVENAQVSGGYMSLVGTRTDFNFMDTFFTRLGAGYTVSAANLAASSSVQNRQALSLQGNTAYKLQ